MPENTDSGREPYTQTSETEKKQNASRQLQLDYRAVFNSPKGQRVLSDLKARFGFGKWPAKDTEDERAIARRVFMQGPLYHIEEQLRTPFKREKKQAKAISAGGES